MLNLVATTDKLQVITSSASDIDVHASWVDAGSPVTSSSNMTPGKTNTAIAASTTTDVVPAPGSNVDRNVKFLSLRNKHASTSNNVTVQYNANDTLYELVKCTLLAGEELVCREGVWFHFDVNGGVYTGFPAASDTGVGAIQLATQAEMETATDVAKAVTPGRVAFHPGVAKTWCKTSPGSVNNASYNVTSVSDTAAGITVIVIATDFSSANWACQCSVESTSDTMTVTNLKFVRIGLGDQAAGQVAIECHDGTAITAVLEDPTAWHMLGHGDL